MPLRDLALIKDSKNQRVKSTLDLGNTLYWLIGLTRMEEQSKARTGWKASARALSDQYIIEFIDEKMSCLFVSLFIENWFPRGPFENLCISSSKQSNLYFKGEG